MLPSAPEPGAITPLCASVSVVPVESVVALVVVVEADVELSVGVVSVGGVWSEFCASAKRGAAQTRPKTIAVRIRFRVFILLTFGSSFACVRGRKGFFFPLSTQQYVGNRRIFQKNSLSMRILDWLNCVVEENSQLRHFRLDCGIATVKQKNPPDFLGRVCSEALN